MRSRDVRLGTRPHILHIFVHPLLPFLARLSTLLIPLMADPEPPAIAPKLAALVLLFFFFSSTFLLVFSILALPLSQCLFLGVSIHGSLFAISVPVVPPHSIPPIFPILAVLPTIEP